MMKITQCVLGTIVLLAMTVLPAQADAVDDVSAKIIAEAEKVKSYTADVSSETNIKNEAMSMKMSVKGTMEVMRQGGKMLSRMEHKTTTDMNMGGTEQKKESQSLMITDGEHSYVLTEESGTKTAMKTKLDPKNQQMVNKGMFEQMKKDYDLKLLADETIDGHDAYVIEGTPKNPAAMGKMTMCFAKTGGMMLKMVMNTPDGKPMTTMTHTNIKVDVAIKPERFKFEAPEGVTVMDMTAGMP